MGDPEADDILLQVQRSRWAALQWAVADRLSIYRATRPVVALSSDGTVRPLVEPVGGTPTYGTYSQIYSPALATADPLTRLFTLLANIPGVGGNTDSALPTTSLWNQPAAFSLAVAADAGGAIASTAFLAAAAAGLKWQIQWVAIQAVQGAGGVATVTLSDSLGDIPINAGFLYGKKQATAATAVTLAASGLAATSVLVIAGQARAVP